MPSFIEIDAQNCEASKINCSVPLPGQNTGKRIIQLDLGLEVTDFLESVSSIGQTYAEAAGITKSSSGIKVDETKAASFLRNNLLKMGHDRKMWKEHWQNYHLCCQTQLKW